MHSLSFYPHKEQFEDTAKERARRYVANFGALYLTYYNMVKNIDVEALEGKLLTQVSECNGRRGRFIDLEKDISRTKLVCSE